MELLIAFLNWLTSKPRPQVPEVGDTLIYCGIWPWLITSIDGDYIGIKSPKTGDHQNSRLSYGGWTLLKAIRKKLEEKDD